MSTMTNESLTANESPDKNDSTSDLDASYSLTPLNLLFCGVKLISIDGTTIYNLVPDT